MYEKIEKLLKKHGITAYELSKATGISTAAMTDYKKGRSKPSVYTLKKIADYFGVTVDYFL